METLLIEMYKGFDEWFDKLILNNDWAGFLILLSLPTMLLILWVNMLNSNE
ncbi:MAG: hypothetical protein IKG79_05290 [Neisseriaceae bacterium]|nr:hypothetical protein [Neisseriaceae bacterium]